MNKFNFSALTDSISSAEMKQWAKQDEHVKKNLKESRIRSFFVLATFLVLFGSAFIKTGADSNLILLIVILISLPALAAYLMFRNSTKLIRNYIQIKKFARDNNLNFAIRNQSKETGTIFRIGRTNGYENVVSGQTNNDIAFSTGKHCYIIGAGKYSTTFFGNGSELI